MRVLGYVRVSTDKQSEEGVSLEAQRAQITNYAAALGYELVGIIEDAGESAKTLERPGWRELVARIERGDAAGVVITKLDRMTRSVRDLGALLDSMFSERRGIALLSVMDSINTHTPGGVLVANVLTSVAQWERMETAARTKRAMRHLAANGVRFGGASSPLGLDLSEERDEHGRRRWIVNHDEIKWLRWMVDARSLRMSLSQMAETLNRNGSRSKSGRLWCPKKVSRALQYAPEILARAKREEQSVPEVQSI